MARLLHRTLTASLLALTVHFALTTTVLAEDLDRTLHKQAPKILKALQDKGYKNVGVLKFRVKKGNEPVSDNVGTLNMTLASKLEVALALANTNDEAKQLGIIQNASGVAAKIRDANHLVKQGRSPLFKETYPMAWGDQQVTPDAFVMGGAKVSPDLKEMTINLMAFDKDNDPAQVVQPFTVTTDGGMLSEMNESFLLRGVFGGGTVKQAAEKSVASANKVAKKEDDYPIQDKSAPVALEVYYDNKLVPFDLKNGRAFIREPQQSQKVVFILKHKREGAERFGVVLKVNGESVLYREKQADAQCHKIVLGPSTKSVPVKGFQTSDKTIREFSVLSRLASKQNEMYYGADVGTICMTVFPEKAGSAPVATYTDEGEDIAAITRGVLPSERPMNLGALKAQLRHNAKQEPTRGIIVGGKETAGGVQRIDFSGEPTPIMSATLVYYRP